MANLSHAQVPASLTTPGPVRETRQETERGEKESLPALVVMGNVQGRHGNTDEAIHLWKRAAQINPKQTELYAKMANLASQTDQYEIAIAMWRKVLESTPQQQGTHHDIANALMQLGDYEACIQEIGREIELSGDIPRSCFLLGQAYQHLQEYEKAKQCFRRVIELQPDHRQACYGLYGVSARLKQREEAQQYLAGFKKLKAEHQEAIRRADESMLTDLECFYAGLASFCGDVQELRRKIGNDPVTEQVLETAFTLGRSNIVFLNRLAVQYSTTNRLAGAMALYRQIAQLDPHNASCHLNIGILAIKTGRADMAEAEFRQAIELSPQDYAGYQELARLYLRTRKNLAEARQLAQKAVELEASGETYYDLGLARLANNDRDGVGARVKVSAGKLTLVDEVHSGRGYQSHYGTRLYFGLGDRKHVDRVEIRWIGGSTDVFRDLPIDQQVTLVEGTSP